MQWSDVRKPPATNTLRDFAILCVVFAVFIVGRRLYELGAIDRVDRAVAALGMAVGLVGLLRPRAIRWLFTASLMATFPLGWVMTRAALLLMFYGVLTPLALVFRAMGRDELKIRADGREGRVSYWEVRRQARRASDYFRQF